MIIHTLGYWKKKSLDYNHKHEFKSRTETSGGREEKKNWDLGSEKKKRGV